MKPEEIRELVIIALVMELDSMEREGVTEERLSRAETYVEWLSGDHE